MGISARLIQRAQQRSVSGTHCQCSLSSGLLALSQFRKEVDPAPAGYFRKGQSSSDQLSNSSHINVVVLLRTNRALIGSQHWTVTNIPRCVHNRFPPI